MIGNTNDAPMNSVADDNKDIYIEIPQSDSTATPEIIPKNQENNDGEKKDPFAIGIQNLTHLSTNNHEFNRVGSASGKMAEYYNSNRFRTSIAVKEQFLRRGSMSLSIGKYSSASGAANDAELAAANSQLCELRSENQNLVYRVQFLEGEVSRHQHQIGACKAQYKALQSEVFELQTAKELYGENNQDMLAEKEELQQEMTEAIMAEREKAQTAQLEIMDLNIKLEKADMELADKERLLSQVMNENNKLKRYRQELRDTDSGQKDVQVKLFHCEKQKAIIERNLEKATEQCQEKDTEIKRLTAENAKLKEGLEKCKAEIGTVGAFMTALAQKNKAESRSPDRDSHKGVSFDLAETGSCNLAETLRETMLATITDEETRKLNNDSFNDVGVELSENLHLRVVHVDNVEEALSIERDGLRALIVEGMVLFEEIYNSYRVMQHIGYEDAKTAARMMIEANGGYDSNHRSLSPPHSSRGRSESYNGVISHQFITSCGGTKGCHFTSWYCQKGPEFLIAWLKCLNLYSPSLVNMLLNSGFWDMHSLVHMTDEDMQALHIVTGIRRKLLSGIDELREKTKIVTEETLSMLRDTYYMSEERYLMERERRSQEGALVGNHEAMKKKKILERAKEDIMETARQLPYEEDMPQSMIEDSKQLTTKGYLGDRNVAVSSAVKKAAPIVLAELLKDMHMWFSDVKIAIDGNEAAVKRALERNSTR
eukprot:Tbor_TRINITY_DN4987_c8_g1::TRINITY_DN4987_c8_g1_i1::g.9816::m.9816